MDQVVSVAVSSIVQYMPALIGALACAAIAWLRAFAQSVAAKNAVVSVEQDSFVSSTDTPGDVKKQIAMQRTRDSLPAVARPLTSGGLDRLVESHVAKLRGEG